MILYLLLKLSLIKLFADPVRLEEILKEIKNAKKILNDIETSGNNFVKELLEFEMKLTTNLEKAVKQEMETVQTTTFAAPPPTTPVGSTATDTTATTPPGCTG